MPWPKCWRLALAKVAAAPDILFLHISSKDVWALHFFVWMQKVRGYYPRMFSPTFAHLNICWMASFGKSSTCWFLKASLLHLLHPAHDYSVLKEAIMLLVAFRDPVVEFAEPYPSFSCTCPVDGGMCALTRKMHVIPQTKKLFMLYFWFFEGAL